MARASLAQLSELTGRLYEAAYDDDQWPAAIEALQAAFHGSAACFMLEHPAGAELISGNCDPYYAELYRDHLLPHDVVWRPMMAAALGTVTTDRCIMPKHEFRKTLFFNEWYRPQGEHSSMACKILAQGDVSGFVVVNRGGRQPDFEAEDRTLMEALAPTLMRVAALRDRVGALGLGARAAARALDTLALALFVVDRDARVLYANGPAQALLDDRAAAVTARQGRLGAGDAAATAALRRLVAGACQDTDDVAGAGGDMMLGEAGDPWPRLALSIAPVRDARLYALPAGRCAAVFVREVGFGLPAGFQSRLRRLFGFSAKEAEIAAQLAAGRSLAEAAAAGRVGITTARTHLARMFRKTDTAQQSQLVALLLKVLPIP